MCCSVLQRLAVSCSVLQCLAVCCSVFSVLQYVVMGYIVLQCGALCCNVSLSERLFQSTLTHVCSELQSVAQSVAMCLATFFVYSLNKHSVLCAVVCCRVCHSVLQCVFFKQAPWRNLAPRCVLQCVAVCCRVLWIVFLEQALWRILVPCRVL